MTKPLTPKSLRVAALFSARARAFERNEFGETRLVTDRLAAGLNAGATYFAVIFLIGFALGALRVLVAAPAIGDVAAVALELPFMLAASWVVCGLLVTWFSLGPTTAERLAMGGSAFVLLLTAEFALALATGRTPATFAADLSSAPGALGLAGQIVFALIPLFHGTWPPSDDGEESQKQADTRTP